jgi:Zn finger protein HypA/HybF involved in hydrogenase expression
MPNVEGQALCNKCNTEYWFKSDENNVCPKCGSAERRLTDAREHPAPAATKKEE